MNSRNLTDNHPCFSKEAHHKYGRVHLPVAPVCNIQCRYCVRDYDCVNESRPGVSSRVLSPKDALERVAYAVNREDSLKVIGIAGPGDPLANMATFETLSAIHREFPEMILCLSTNGLLLPDCLGDLVNAGVSHLTVTINAISPETAHKIYAWVVHRGKMLEGEEASLTLLNSQWSGLSAAVETGFKVKVNFVLIPGINDHEATEVARVAGRMGVDLMNVIPMMPQGMFENLEKPSSYQLTKIRNECEKYVPQMRHCRQCRADAFGLLGSDKDAETETLLGHLGEEYLEMLS